MKTSACILACLFASVVAAAAPALLASDAWIRATPGSEVAAAYLTVRNTSAAPVTIVAVRSAAAGAAMIHETRLAGTQSTMRPRAEVVVPAGESVRFAPEGLHVMLQGLLHPLRVGDAVPLVLVLKDGGTVEVSAHVRPLATD